MKSSKSANKKELWVINAELTNANQELKSKMVQVSQLNNNFKSLINFANAGTIFLDRYFRIKLFTPAAQEFFNLVSSDLERPLSDITSHLEYDDLLKDAARVLKKQQPIEREVKVKENRTYLVQISPYHITEDSVSGVVILFMNITERKEAEEALRESEEKLHVILESAIDYAIISTNTKGLIESWNSGAEHIFDYKPEEVKGKPAHIIFTDEDRVAGIPEKEMQTAREEGRAIDERWHQRKDGSKFFMSGVMRPIYNGGLIGYLKVARDMTEQKLAEQQKDEFIGIASHELKTPVTSIKAYAELLRETIGKTGNTEDEQLVIKLDTQIDRLIELIHSLLDTTKIAEGQLFLSMEDFDLHKLAVEKIEELKPTTNIHALKLAGDNNVFIKADRKRIEEVFSNLISNAIKYSPNGGDVVVTIEKKKEDVEVSIKDNGIGIPEYAKTKLFGRFFRVRDPHVETYPGMGLGLYIASAIIKRHNGKIWLTSKLNEGSTFFFSLPYK